MIRWIRSHADPDECLAILLAGICLWAGWATWNDDARGASPSYYGQVVSAA